MKGGIDMEPTKDLMEQMAKLMRAARRRPAGRHLPRGMHRLLGAVLAHDGIRAAELAQQLDIRPASLSEALGRLEGEGLIRREKDESDARATRVFATEKAREAHAEFEQQRRAQNERLRTYLSEEEAGAFCETCDKLTDFFQNEYEAKTPRGEGLGRGRRGERGGGRHGHQRHAENASRGGGRHGAADDL
jgi:DNA-binding MarR family transcriptional regulator